MSTLKSSAEDLTLNADGSGNDIKFQSNAVEKASIDSSGNLTVSGNLTSVGIDDNASSVVITLESDGDISMNNGSDYSWIRPWNSTTGDMIISADHSATGTGGSNMLFKTRGSEKLRIQNGGGISFNGDTAAANALDDYEEGTWTPTFQNVTVTTYDQQYGYYTRIGNRVFFDGICSASNIDNTDSSAVSFTGLPFTISDNTEAYPSVSLFSEDGANPADNRPMGLGIKSATYILMYVFTPGTGDNTTFLTYQDCGSALRFRFSGHYIVS